MSAEAPPLAGRPAEGEVEVVEESPSWRSAGLDPDALAHAALAAASAEIALGRARPVTVVFGDDALIRRLNAAFRGVDAPTNVLAFPAAPAPGACGEGPGPLGDIVLAFETIAQEAAALGIPRSARALHMVVHGFLHLHGYDHQTDDEAEKMESMERSSLARLGLPDPYEVDAHA